MKNCTPMLILDSQTLPNIRDAVNAVVNLHDKYFVQQLNWEATFLDDVEGFLNELMLGFQPNRDGLWLARNESGFIGSIAIDGKQYNKKCARLRVFVVDPSLHHQGVGKALLNHAIQFCKSSGFQRIELWTFDSLIEAGELYLSYDFSIIKERDVVYWGCHLREQLFSLELPQIS